MDQKELHLQHAGICYKLYNFIMKIMAEQATKTVTLGKQNGPSSIGVPISNNPPCEGVNSNEL